MSSGLLGRRGARFTAATVVLGVGVSFLGYWIAACEGFVPLPCEFCYSRRSQGRILHCEGLTSEELREVEILRRSGRPWLRARLVLTAAQMEELSTRCGPLTISRSSVVRSVRPLSHDTHQVLLEGAVIVRPL
jgi:hypothetical protein